MGRRDVRRLWDGVGSTDFGRVLPCSTGELSFGAAVPDLIERTKDFTVENAAKGYFPQLSFSGKASYQSDVTKMPFSIPGSRVRFG